MLIVDYSITLGLICFYGIRERALYMTRLLHILLCLMALLNGSGVSSECDFECCSDASGVHSSSCASEVSCASEDCGAACLPETSGSDPCDRQCCDTLGGNSLLSAAGAEESLEGISGFSIVDRLNTSADVHSLVMPSTQPRSLVKTHLLVCVFLC